MDILLEKDFIRSVVASGPAFREFGVQNWRRVHQAVFVWCLQPRNPEILLPVFYVTHQVNGQANANDLEIKIALRELCAEELWPWEFSQYMAIHNMIRRILFKNHSMRPSVALLRDTHISKNSHRLRSPSHPQSGAIRHDKRNSNCNPSISKAFWTQFTRVRRMTPFLRNGVFSNLQVTKMYDSLPMALFRSTRLASIMNYSVADSDTT
jgi:hypothetical protein